MDVVSEAKVVFEEDVKVRTDESVLLGVVKRVHCDVLASREMLRAW